MLKIMTLNLNLYSDKHGPWSDRREIIRQAIERSAPDIVAFQAAAKHLELESGIDQPAQFEVYFPQFHYQLFRASTLHEDGSEDGTGILATGLPSQVNHLQLEILPEQEDQNSRVVTHVQFDVPDPLHLFNVYFSWVDQQATRNAEQTLAFLDSFVGNAVVVGDFNNTAASRAIRMFRENGWVDAWDRLHAKEPGNTFLEHGVFSKRIDYVFVRKPLEEKLQSIEVVADQPDTKGHHASDHAGLCAAIELW